MLGVDNVDPKQPRWENPMSSNRMMITFGASSPGCGRDGHHGSDSVTVRPIRPSNFSLMVSPDSDSVDTDVATIVVLTILVPLPTVRT